MQPPKYEPDLSLRMVKERAWMEEQARAQRAANRTGKKSRGVDSKKRRKEQKNTRRRNR